MRKKVFIPVALVIVVLGVIAALSILAGHSSSATVAMSDPDLNVPSANMSVSPNWKAQPASGAAVSLGFPNFKVNPGTSQEATNEPYVAVDPNNANHIVVGANSWVVGNGHFEAFAYTTFDGGKTWSSSQPYINRNASRLNAADPTVAFGADGSVYFAFVAMTPADGAVAVSRSIDGGRTWNSQSWASSFTSGADKPAIAWANGSLYLFYQNGSLYSSVSRDGANWSAATLIEAGGRNANPVVDAKGNVNVFYNTASSIKLARLSIADSFSVSTVANTVALQPRAAQYRAGIYAAGGVDRNGTMYVAWADGRNAGHGNDILVSRSVDGGRIWSAPSTVNSDAGNADQLMPALAIGRDGVVNVSWLDTRNDANRVNYDVYMASATDGVHFGANQRVSNVSSNPNNDPRTQGSMIGDYFGLAAGNGVVYSVWTDTRNNVENIYMAPVPSSSAGN